jgi:hypothetical protein
MSVLSRWSRPPAQFRSLLGPQERVLAMNGRSEGGTEPLVVATQLGLWLPVQADAGADAYADAGAGATDPAWRRIGWDRVVKATWSGGVLEVIEGERDADGVVTDLPTVRVALSEPRNVPSVVRTRVENSIARSELVQLPGGSGRIVARRVPGVDGLTWTARLDTGTRATPDSVATLRHYLDRLTADTAVD